LIAKGGVVFSDKLREKIDRYINRYETKRSSIIPILHAIQDEYGWISFEHMSLLAERYALNLVHIQEVATFYSAFCLTPCKPYRILFCENIVCHIMGAKLVMEKIRRRIKIYEENSGESPISLEGVPCLGVCDGAPAMLVNKDRHLRVTEKNIDEILDRYAPLP